MNFEECGKDVLWYNEMWNKLQGADPSGCAF